MRLKVTSKNKAERNGMWAGDSVGYTGIHLWVRNRLPNSDTCSACGKRGRMDLANISQEYKRDLSDWKFLCRRCHMTQDGRIGTFYQNTRAHRTKRIDRVCETCRKHFKAIPYQVKQGWARYCSWACRCTNTARGKSYKKEFPEFIEKLKDGDVQ